LTATVTRAPDYGDNGTGNVVVAATWSQQPTPYTGITSRDVGGGKIYTILDGFNIGTYVGQRTVNAYKRARLQTERMLTVSLQNHDAPFDDINDSGKITKIQPISTKPHNQKGIKIGYSSNNGTVKELIYFSEDLSDLGLNQKNKRKLRQTKQWRFWLKCNLNKLLKPLLLNRLKKKR
jgi:hypothetical protein